MTKSNSAEGLKLGTRFDEVRQRLLQSQFTDRLARPLEYWVLPSDRRLPLALLHRTLNDLLSTPFHELSATPGIGQKKISSLVKLLDRATHDEPPLASVGADGRMEGETVKSASLDPAVFDPSIVSEALWAEWREAVRQADVGHELLGRVAPSLQRLPTVIWQTPLRQYLDHSVAEIRRLRTHGEKRVRCVLEVFHAVYYQLSQQPVAELRQNVADRPTDQTDSLHRRLTPLGIKALVQWVDQQFGAPQLPTADAIAAAFTAPLMAQIELDCGETVLQLVRDRLGLSGTSRSVREQSRELGVTRARIYQLLDDCAKTMAVRWPEGASRLDDLATYFSQLEGDPAELRDFYGLRELCFPSRQRADADNHSDLQGAAPPEYDSAPELEPSGDTAPTSWAAEVPPSLLAANRSDPTAMPAAVNSRVRIDEDGSKRQRDDETPGVDRHAPHVWLHRPDRVTAGEPAQATVRIRAGSNE